MTTSEIEVLLLDKATGVQIGSIQFRASGMLICEPSKKVHMFALQSPDHLFSEQWLKEPLAMKYADLLRENPKLPDEILEQEAKSCADFLNTLKRPLMIGNYSIKAQVVHREY